MDKKPSITCSDKPIKINFSCPVPPPIDFDAIVKKDRQWEWTSKLAHECGPVDGIFGKRIV